MLKIEEFNFYVNKSFITNAKNLKLKFRKFKKKNKGQKIFEFFFKQVFKNVPKISDSF